MAAGTARDRDAGGQRVRRPRREEADCRDDRSGADGRARVLRPQERPPPAVCEGRAKDPRTENDYEEDVDEEDDGGGREEEAGYKAKETRCVVAPRLSSASPAAFSQERRSSAGAESGRNASTSITRTARWSRLQTVRPMRRDFCRSRAKFCSGGGDSGRVAHGAARARLPRGRLPAAFR